MFTEQERAYVWLALSDGLGPRRIARLFAYCGDAVELTRMSEAEWARHVGGVLASNMRVARDKVEGALEALERIGARVITRESDEYPEWLAQVYDPPAALFARGTAPLLHEKMLAMVGARICTNYGRDVARSIATQLAQQGVCIVSGLARGIDSACHSGALAGGGETIAVLGCGLDVVYPPENAELYERIAANGLIVTEYLPGTQPLPSHFPLRNRIISGLTKGVVLIEAGRGSGTLITADYALEHGREIFAVPGNITSAKSSETNRLIREGANVATCAQDILFGMKWLEKEVPAKENRVKVQLSRQEAEVVSALCDQDMSFEELIELTEMEAPSLNSLLTMLTLRGIIKQSAGRVFSVNREIQ